jgi:hypothetical protein
LVYNPDNVRRRNLKYMDNDDDSTIVSDLFSNERLEAVAELIYGYSLLRNSNTIYEDLYDYINNVI